MAILLLIHFHRYQLHDAKEAVVVYVKRKYVQSSGSALTPN